MQDWKPVIINGGKVKNKKTLETKNKQKHTESSKKNKKLDDSTEAKKIEKVPKEIARQIIDARVAKKWKQKDLANAMSIPVKRIQEIESGKAINNMAYFQRYLVNF